MKLGLLLFLIGIEGFILNNKNLILMLICLEIMLLATTVLVLTFSITFDDLFAHIYALYIIILAGAESAIGLAILVAFYRLRGEISLSSPS
uniref:NADH-ubiquinone oxidoreductase chain 4L n=1 Tax=Capillidium heterosporum TaxID=1167838 RepID=A0A3Q9U0T7_9FUNG|nr:NADH dehydrogenase subunit 4L [Capillidium heterosporum]YP_010417165.1 NADH dehydrogenase subunit 4L [Capillidium rhysosporum]AZZ06708.1 NADH dehydrogenase subunit 4L [Capillidium heterosporum]QWY25712.1 NADH dehydrogenase subunit 4L [Capillidium rhysosporum]